MWVEPKLAFRRLIRRKGRKHGNQCTCRLSPTPSSSPTIPYESRWINKTFETKPLNYVSTACKEVTFNVLSEVTSEKPPLWTNLHLGRWERGSRENKECFCGTLRPAQSLCGRCSSCYVIRVTSHVGGASSRLQWLVFLRDYRIGHFLTGVLMSRAERCAHSHDPFVFLTSLVSRRPFQTDFVLFRFPNLNV